MPVPSYPSAIMNGYKPRITCLTCGEGMVLIFTQPMTNRYEGKTYGCEDCGVMETFLTDKNKKGSP